MYRIVQVILIAVLLCSEGAMAQIPIATVGYPNSNTQMEVGRTYSITIQLTNTGATHSTVLGYADISFRTLDFHTPDISVTESNSTFANPVDIIRAGDLIWPRSGNQISADYLLFSYSDQNWSNQEMHYAILHITPTQPGQFYIQYRGQFITSDFANVLSMDPTDGSGNGVDQQGWPLWRQLITVVAQPNDPICKLTPSTLDFGSVTIGQSRDMTIQVENSGEGTLTGTATAPAPFSIVGSNSYSLTAGQTKSVIIRFAPTEAITYDDRVKFNGNSSKNAAVYGKGVQDSGGGDIAGGLVAYYPFNSNATDASGNGNNGNVFGPTLVAGHDGTPNSAFLFDGQNDYIRVPHSSSLSISGDLSMAFWVNIHGKSNQAGFDWQAMVMKTSDGNSFGSIVSASNALRFYHRDNSSTNSADWYTQYGWSSLQTNTWYHLAMVYTGTQVVYYINGSQVASFLRTGSIVPNTTDLLMGMDGNADGSPNKYPLNGALDEVRIYNKSLSAMEVEELAKESGGQPIVTLTSPNGGEHWQISSDHSIEWKLSGGLVTEISTYLSFDGGNIWEFLTGFSPNGLSESTIASFGAKEAVECKIRIHVSGPGGEYFDESDGLFALTSIANDYPTTLFAGSMDLPIYNVHGSPTSGSTLPCNIRIFGPPTIPEEGTLNVAVHLDARGWNDEDLKWLLGTALPFETTPLQPQIGVILPDDGMALVHEHQEAFQHSGWHTATQRPWWLNAFNALTSFIGKQAISWTLGSLNEIGGSHLGTAVKEAVLYQQIVYAMSSIENLDSDHSWQRTQLENQYDVSEVYYHSYSGLDAKPRAHRFYLNFDLGSLASTLDLTLNNVRFSNNLQSAEEWFARQDDQFVASIDLKRIYQQGTSPLPTDISVPVDLLQPDLLVYWSGRYQLQVYDDFKAPREGVYKYLLVTVSGPKSVLNGHPFLAEVRTEIENPDNIGTWQLGTLHMNATMQDDNGEMWGNCRAVAAIVGESECVEEPVFQSTGETSTNAPIYILGLKAALTLGEAVLKPILVGVGVAEAVVVYQELSEPTQQDIEKIYDFDEKFDRWRVPEFRADKNGSTDSRRIMQKTYIPIKMKQVDDAISISLDMPTIERRDDWVARPQDYNQVIIKVNPAVCAASGSDKLVLTAYCPVSLSVQRGSAVTGPGKSDIPGSQYIEGDFDGSGDIDSRVIIGSGTKNVYKVKLVRKEGAEDTATFMLTQLTGAGIETLIESRALGTLYDTSFFVSTLDTGSISGLASSGGLGLTGIPVDLSGEDGNVLQSAVTGTDGRYLFGGLNNGKYIVSISTPLGFKADPDTKEISVKGLPHEVNFELTKLEIVAQQRSRGYWANQLFRATTCKPQDYKLADFAKFVGLVDKHFNQNHLNPVDFYQVPQPATQTDSLNVLRKLLHMMNTDGEEPFVKRLAKSELIALMLNVVSGKVSQTYPITKDGQTISQAITYCDMLVNDEVSPANDGHPGCDGQWARYIRASYILTLANCNIKIPAGIIPPDVIQIAYRLHSQETLPAEFALHQNYPNPFNPVTNFEFALPSASDVRLEIYNTLGQRVVTLVDGRMDAGLHIASWDASARASGVYLYRLTAGDFVETRKMVLLK